MGYQSNRVEAASLVFNFSSAETVLIESDNAFSSSYASIRSAIQPKSHASLLRPCASSSALFPDLDPIRYPITFHYLDRHVVNRNKTHLPATYHSDANPHFRPNNIRAAVFHPSKEAASNNSAHVLTEITTLPSHPETRKVSAMPFLEKHGKKLAESKPLAQQSP